MNFAYFSEARRQGFSPGARVPPLLYWLLVSANKIKLK